MKYKILYINPISEISGAEISLLMLIKNLSREFFEPIVVLPNNGPLYDEISKSKTQILLSPINKLKLHNPFPYFLTILSFYRIFKRIKPDIIHANMDICSQYAFLPAKLFKIPLIVHTRNILNKRAFQRMFLFCADVLIANSKAVMQSFAAYSQQKQIKDVVYNGVDLTVFTPSQGKRCVARAKYGFCEADFVIGLFGRIHPTKGHENFLNALTYVLKHYKNIKALIAGSTDIDHSQQYLSQLKKIVEQNNQNTNIMFLEYEKDNVSLFSAIDLLVCPSENEPFGRVLIEAMAMGIPVIANRFGGPLEIVDDGINGYLIDVNDVNIFTDTIIKLYGDPFLRKEMGKKGHNIVQNKFSIRQSTESLESIYKNILKIYV